MKKLGFIALLFLAVFVNSCGGIGGGSETNIDKDQLVGKWMTSDAQYFEVYYSDGTGKEWDLRDDVQEEEASVFTWEFDEGAKDKKTAKKMSKAEFERTIESLEQEMREAAKNLDFERAMELRDIIFEMKCD